MEGMRWKGRGGKRRKWKKRKLGEDGIGTMKMKMKMNRRG
jgi:hypothetical protein